MYRQLFQTYKRIVSTVSVILFNTTTTVLRPLRGCQHVLVGTFS